MNRLVQDIYAARCRLDRVYYEMSPPTESIWGVFLVFSGPVYLSVACDDEFDDIVLGDRKPGYRDKWVHHEDPDCWLELVCEDASHCSPWMEAVGRPILNAFTLTNHRGTEDMVQLEFRDTLSDPGGRTIQMEGAGSSILVRMLLPTFTTPRTHLVRKPRRIPPDIATREQNNFDAAHDAIAEAANDAAANANMAAAAAVDAAMAAHDAGSAAATAVGRAADVAIASARAGEAHPAVAVDSAAVDTASAAEAAARAAKAAAEAAARAAEAAAAAHAARSR